MKALVYIAFWTVFGTVLLGLSGIISATVGSRYLLAVGGAVGAALLAGAISVWAIARGRTFVAWSFGWAAGAIVCFGLGCYYLPLLQMRWIAGSAFDAERRCEEVRAAYANPVAQSEKAWVMFNEKSAAIAELRWEYERRLRETDPHYTHPQRNRAIACYAVGALAILMAALGRPGLNRLASDE